LARRTRVAAGRRGLYAGLLFTIQNTMRQTSWSAATVLLPAGAVLAPAGFSQSRTQCAKPPGDIML